MNIQVAIAYDLREGEAINDAVRVLSEAYGIKHIASSFITLKRIKFVFEGPVKNIGKLTSRYMEV